MKPGVNPVCTRRSFLYTLLGVGAATFSVSANQAGKPVPNPYFEPSGSTAGEPVIEWNAHIFSPDVQRYPLHPKAVYKPDM